jgi:hypothetical protein
MQKLSTGDDATLGSYLRLCEERGMDGGAELIRKKIAESPNGADEEVLASEEQMVVVLLHASIPTDPQPRS